MSGGLFSLLPEPRLLPRDVSPAGLPAAGKGPGNAEGLVSSFHDTFKKVMGDVNHQQFYAEDQARAFAAGDIEDIHDVALAINKAKFMLDLTVKVRDKLLDAYRELSMMR